MELADILFLAIVVWLAINIDSGGGGRRARVPI